MAVGEVRGRDEARAPHEARGLVSAAVETSSAAAEAWLIELKRTGAYEQPGLLPRLHLPLCLSGNPLCQLQGTLHPDHQPWIRPARDGFGNALASWSNRSKGSYQGD